MHTEDGVVSPDKVTTIRHVSINRGIEWIAAGFNLLMKKPAEFIIAGLVLCVITFVLNFMPVMGSAMAVMVGVVAAGAFMLACRALEEGQDPLLAAQKAPNITPLWILSLIAACLGLAVGFLGLMLAGGVMAAAFASPMLAMGLGAISVIVMLLISIPMLMALWLAPGLLVLKGVDPITALRLSFAAAAKNFPAFIVFYVLAWIATFVGAMLLGIGLIFVYPVLLCASYFAYKEIFGTVSGGEAVGFIPAP